MPEPKVGDLQQHKERQRSQELHQNRNRQRHQNNNQPVPPPEQMNQRREAAPQFPLMQQAGLIDVLVPEREMSHTDMNSISTAYRDVHQGQRIGMKERFSRSRSDTRRKRERGRAATDAENHLMQNISAMKLHLSDRSRYPEIGNRDVLVRELAGIMDHTNMTRSKFAMMEQRYRDALGSEQALADELQRSTEEFLEFDISSLACQNDDEFVAKYAQIRDFTLRASAMNNLVSKLDEYGVPLTPDQLHRIKVRTDACYTLGVAIDNKRKLMNNPYYHLLRGSDVAGLTLDEINRRTEEIEDLPFEEQNQALLNYYNLLGFHQNILEQGADPIHDPVAFEQAIARDTHVLQDIVAKADQFMQEYNQQLAPDKVQTIINLSVSRYGGGGVPTQAHERMALSRIGNDLTEEELDQLYQERSEIAARLMNMKNAPGGEDGENEARASCSLDAQRFRSLEKFFGSLSENRRRYLEEKERRDGNETVTLNAARILGTSAYAEMWLEDHEDVLLQGHRDLVDHANDWERPGAQQVEEHRRTTVLEEPEPEQEEVEAEPVNLSELFEATPADVMAREDLSTRMRYAKDELALRRQAQLDSFDRLTRINGRLGSDETQARFAENLSKLGDIQRQMLAWFNAIGSEHAQEGMNWAIMQGFLVGGKSLERSCQLIFDEFLHSDLSILKYRTDTELTNNFVAQKELFSRGMEVRRILQYAKERGVEIDPEDEIKLLAMSDVCEEAARLSGAHANIISSPKYAELAPESYESLTDDELQQKIKDAYDQKDKDTAEFYTALLQLRGEELDRNKSAMERLEEAMAAHRPQVMEEYNKRQEGKEWKVDEGEETPDLAETYSKLHGGKTLNRQQLAALQEKLSDKAAIGQVVRMRQQGFDQLHDKMITNTIWYNQTNMRAELLYIDLTATREEQRRQMAAFANKGSEAYFKEWDRQFDKLLAFDISKIDYSTDEALGANLYEVITFIRCGMELNNTLDEVLREGMEIAPDRLEKLRELAMFGEAMNQALGMRLYRLQSPYYDVVDEDELNAMSDEEMDDLIMALEGQSELLEYVKYVWKERSLLSDPTGLSLQDDVMTNFEKAKQMYREKVARQQEQNNAAGNA